MSEYAEICSAGATSSQLAPAKSNAGWGANPIECRAPSRPSTCSASRSASRSKSSWEEASSSTTGARSGSRRAIAEVIFAARPNEVSTTVAPSSCARRATWNAMEDSVSTPVTRIFLPSSKAMKVPSMW